MLYKNYIDRNNLPWWPAADQFKYSKVYSYIPSFPFTSPTRLQGRAEYWKWFHIACPLYRFLELEWIPRNVIVFEWHMHDQWLGPTCSRHMPIVNMTAAGHRAERAPMPEPQSAGRPLFRLDNVARSISPVPLTLDNLDGAHWNFRCRFRRFWRLLRRSSAQRWGHANGPLSDAAIVGSIQRIVAALHMCQAFV